MQKVQSFLQLLPKGKEKSLRYQKRERSMRPNSDAREIAPATGVFQCEYPTHRGRYLASSVLREEKSAERPSTARVTSKTNPK